MSEKKLVSYSMLALGTAQLAFSLAQHLAGHEVTLMEVLKAFILLSAAVVLYSTDAHKIVVSTARAMCEHVEVSVVDQANYLIADFVTSFCRYFRRTHTGVLSHNMLAVFIGIVLLMILLFIFGGFIL